MAASVVVMLEVSPTAHESTRNCGEAMGDTGTRPELRGQRIFDLGFPVAVMIIAALYAAFQLTPSSYARALYMVGVTDTGLLFGFPQEERSDEWALWTPYLQIAVNNGFARIEHISPYEADLRNFNCLPLWDWGLIFKPQMWAFFAMAAGAGVFADVRDPARRLRDRILPARARAALPRFLRQRFSRSACSRCNTCSCGGRRPDR